MDKTNLTINPSKPSELEFDVNVQGVEDDKQQVRFVLIGSDNIDYSIRCKHKGGNTWIVSFPKVKQLINQQTVPFRIEIVVDGYYFEPVQGDLALVDNPDVTVSKQPNKPTVSTSFKESKSTVKEGSGSGGPEVTGQYAPTNGLLVPEEPPVETHHPIHPQEDNDIDYANLPDIASEVIPGEGTDDNAMGQEFDPKNIAKSIVSNTIGNIKRPERPGSLFAKNETGKPIIPGLDDEETAKKKQDQDQKIRKILSGQ